jgi:hypothetical protein
MITTAILAWGALILQFYLIIHVGLADGMSLTTIIGNYFSFFTILMNSLVAIGLTCSLYFPRTKPGLIFSSPIVIGGTATYVSVGCLAYSLLLRNTWNPQGWQKVADILLHDVVPVLFFFYWLLFISKFALRWKDAFLWMIFPALYLVYALIRGEWLGRYPYHFIDVVQLGYPRVSSTSVVLTLGFLSVGLLLVAISRFVAKAVNRSPI